MTTQLLSNFIVALITSLPHIFKLYSHKLTVNVLNYEPRDTNRQTSFTKYPQSSFDTSYQLHNKVDGPRPGSQNDHLMMS